MPPSQPSGTTSGQLDFTKIIEERTRDFTGREWVFSAVEQWRAQSLAPVAGAAAASRMFLLTGGPGTGKTAIAARIVQMHLEQLQSAVPAHLGARSLSYFHFCQAGLDSTLSPVTFVQSLAESLANRYPEYRKSLESTSSQQFSITANVNAGRVASGAAVTGVAVHIEVLGGNARLLFDLIVRRPLQELCLQRPNEPILILVDSLDEARTFSSESNIAQLLTRVDDFPPQVQFLVTCRSNDSALESLADATTLDLIADAPSDHGDVESYAKVRLRAVPEPQRSQVAERVARRSDGNFLYAFHVLNDLTRAGADLSAVDEADLPVGLEGVYRKFLQLQLVADEKQWSKVYRSVLGVIAVARGEGLTKQQIIGTTKLADDVADDVLTTSAQYLVGGEDNRPYRIYHQSFRDFLLEDAKFSVVPAERHAAIAGYMEDRYGDDWSTCTDSYALRHTPYHWAEAARLSENQREERTKFLVGLIQNPGYRRAFERREGDLPALQEDLQRAVRTAVLNDQVRMLPWVIKAAKGLVDFNRDYLQGEAVVDLADRGDVERAEARLRLFADLQEDWQTAARLILAWLAAARNLQGAKNLMERISQASPAAGGTLLRLQELLRLALAGAPKFPCTDIPAPSIEMGKALVKRISGQDFDRELLLSQLNPTLLVGARQVPGMETDEDSRYGAADDAPMLVAMARVFPPAGTDLMDRYIDAHAGYNYIEYRNRSLWFVLGAVLNFHPDEPWVRARLRRILVAALTGGAADFREALPLTSGLLEARSRSTMDTALKFFGMTALQKATQLQNTRGTDDTWGFHKRRLASLMELSALVARDAAGASVLMNVIRNLPGGFAGFQAPAFLRVADAVCAAGVDFPASRDHALEMAERVAHNIQDYHFCARITARCNSLKRWHAQGLAGEKLVDEIRRLATASTLREFPAVHAVGEAFKYRNTGGQGVLSVSEAQDANRLDLLAEVFQRAAADFRLLNPELPPYGSLPPGTPVNVPDPGLAPLLAVHMAARSLADATLEEKRPALIRSLIPTASVNPTALDTVLSYLLIAVQPANPELAQAIAAEAGPVTFGDLAAPLGQIGPDATILS